MAYIPKGSRRSPWLKAKIQHERKAGQDLRYWSYKWKQARKTYLRTHPLCANCYEFANVVDHIEPVRLGTHDFYDPDNWQPLCTHCHAVKSGQERWGSPPPK